MRLVRTAWGLLVASPARLVVLIAGSVAVALAATSVVLAAATSLASVRSTVDAGWRGSYDLLVLPPGFELREVDGRSVVPANYLGARTGGITREQWKTVLAIPGVEVAAPAASLGWVRDASQLVEMVPARELLLSDGVFRVTVTIRIGEDESSEDYVFAGHKTSVGQPEDPVIYSVDLRTPYIELGQVPAAWTQVVGVDPVQENRLVGLRSFTDGGYLTRGVGRVFDSIYEREAVSVPVLLAETAAPGSLRVRLDRIAGVTPADAELAVRAAAARARAEGRKLAWRRVGDFADRVVARLISNRGRVSTVHDARAPLSRFVQPLSSDLIQLTRTGRLRSPDDASGGGDAVGRDVVLVPGYDNYEQSGDTHLLRLAPAGTWSDDVQPRIDKLQPPRFCCAPPPNLGGDEALYRELTVDKPKPLLADQVGSYDLDALAGQVASAVNYVPLGVYAEAPRRLVEAADGEPVDRVLPSSPFNPGGLNPSPPTGLTNLETVEALRGERFIDAIRVRVEGISGYSPQAVTEIENVAGAILSRTGLQVVVVAGSSPVDVLVEVPGVGVVSERWTTLGTVAEIVSGAEGLSGVLLGAAGGVAVGYLLVAGVFLVVDQRQALEVLARVGWRRRSIRALVGWQAAMLGAASGVLAVAALGGLRLGGAAVVPWWSLGAVLVAVLVAHVAATVVVAAAWAASARARGRGRVRVRSGGAWSGGVWGFAWRHVTESPLRLVGVAVVVGVAVALAAFVAAAVLAFGGRLQSTVLGELVAVRIGGYHVLAAGAAMFAAGAIALYVALLAVERRIALLGLLRALGWRAGQLRRLVTVEAAAPVLAGGLLGMAAAAGIAAVTGLWVQLLTVAAAGLVLTTAVAVVALRAPVAAALRMVPGITLRAEGATGAVPALATRATLAVVGVLTLGLGLASLGWSAARPAAIPAGAFVTPPAPTPPSEAELRIRADVKELAGLGERAPGSPALARARDHVKTELEEVGYSIAEEPFVGPALDLLDAQGRPVLDDDDALVDRNRDDPGILFKKSLAYDPQVVRFPRGSYPLTLADATTGLAGIGCPPGVVVLRINSDAQAALAHQLLDSCAGRTAAVMTVEMLYSDRDWAALHAAVRARLPVEHGLYATSPVPAAGEDAPVLVATVESTGPGAAQSAAPVAVALEAARSAAEQQVPLDVAVIVPSNGEIATLVRRHWATRPTAPMIFLGPMGSDITPVLGASEPATLGDAATVRTTLLFPVAADPAAQAWIDATASLAERATSPTLLDTLTESTGTPIGPDYGPSLYALTLGLDAAYLGEPPTLTFTDGIAGTPADTPDQLDYPTLTRIAAGLVAVPATTTP